VNWTIERVEKEFGEDVLRDLVRDLNDLACGNAGFGAKVNRFGIPDEVWAKLLKQGGYGPDGVERALKGERLGQKDAVGPFRPYTIHTIRDVVESAGGPLTDDELHRALLACLKYRQLAT
jgi:hypothetical protein